MKKITFIIFFYLSYISISFSQSMSQELSFYIFTTNKERVKISIGNLNKSRSNFKIVVRKLKFSEIDTRIIINELSGMNSNDEKMVYLEQTKPEYINEKTLAKNITLPGNRYMDYKVPVFELEENMHNFYEICMLSEEKGGYSISICTRTIIYYSPR
ncbi:hypothetical protein [Vibrio harveyi]|uniref:hypothetical protein n=1 Tax=Vibrio harveyi TaxID=669 RepID=UPI0037368424